MYSCSIAKSMTSTCPYFFTFKMLTASSVNALRASDTTAFTWIQIIHNRQGKSNYNLNHSL